MTEEEAFHMKILAQNTVLENLNGKTYHALSPTRERDYFAEGYIILNHTYKIKYQHAEYEIVCLELRKDGEQILVIPEFLLPRRPYPIYVYLYAILIYSSHPTMSQRKAAEQTRKKFGLETFAHTTLGRALKAIVESISSLSPPKEPAPETKPEPTSFPSLRDTENQRARAAEYLSGWLNAKMIDKEPKAFLNSCLQLAQDWYAKYSRRLL